MSLKKTVRAAARVVLTNVRLACGKLLHGGRLRYSPDTCLALSDEVEISCNGTIGFSKGLHTRGRCRFNVQESGLLVFGRGVLLLDAKPSSIAAAISELIGGPVFHARLAMAVVASMRRPCPVEKFAAASKNTGVLDADPR